MQVVSNYSLPFTALKGAAKPAPVQPQQPDRPAAQPLQPVAEKTSGVWETGSFSFRDILDVINPLQHIPVISTLYRKFSGDEMGYASRIAGDTLFGGAVGSLVSSLVSAIANVFVDSTTGKDIGEHLVAAVMPSEAPARRPPAVNPTYAASDAIPGASYPQPVASPLLHAAPAQQFVRSGSGPAGVADVLNQPQLLAAAKALPAQDLSRAQVAIDQYKWQTMADIEQENRSSHWV
ncbi:MAG: hypothetical protein R8K50_03590 [Mariprofundus sp.]